jgi:hypothetical protein
MVAPEPFGGGLETAIMIVISRRVPEAHTNSTSIDSHRRGFGPPFDRLIGRGQPEKHARLQ